VSGQAHSPEAKAKDVFRQKFCNQKMTREYFVLLGRFPDAGYYISSLLSYILHCRMTNYEEGVKLIDSTMIFQHLCMLGHQKSLDYLSRMAIAALAFSDGGYISGPILKIWTTSSSCTADLREYSHSILHTLLHSRPHEFLKWGIDVLVYQQ